MSKRLKKLSFMLILVILIFSLVGCGSNDNNGGNDNVGNDNVGNDNSGDSGDEPVAEKTSITILIYANPVEFHGFNIGSGLEETIGEMVMLSLAEIDPDGNYYPELATEIPTIENGGVVLDTYTYFYYSDEYGYEYDEYDYPGYWYDTGMTVTWHLREDVYWEDGEQVTADDVIFTWEAMQADEVWTSSADSIISVEKEGDFTLVVAYYYPEPEYVTSFGGENFFVYAEHFCDIEQGYLSWDCDSQPLSAGPYILEEWVQDDYLRFVRNENYYVEGKPSIDEVIFRIVTEESVKRAIMDEGDADLHYWPAENHAISYQEEGNGTKWAVSPTERWVMKLFFNTKAWGDDETPHPFLADVRVRRALRMSVDVDTLVNDIFLGFGKPVWTDFFRPPFDSCGIPRPEFNMAGATALLKEAGWEDTDGDGINECHGCLYAEEGDLMTAEFVIWSGYGETLELAQQFVAEAWSSIGLQTELGMIEDAVLWASADEGGTELAGKFEIDMWDDGYGGVDPTAYLWDYYYYAEDSAWNLANWTGEKAEEVGALIDSLYTMDEDYRLEAFCEMALILEEELPYVELFSTLEMHGLSERLHGVLPTAFDIVTWNVADWYIEE